MTYRFGSFRVDPQREELWNGNRPIQLNRQAVRVLLALIQRRGEVVSKEELVAEVWPGRGATQNNLSQHIFLLRDALGEGAGKQRYVLTVPSVGYRFVAPLESGEAESAARIAARDYCEVARESYERRSPGDIERAISLYETALQHDPRCVPAYAGLAVCRMLLADYLFESPRASLEIAERDARRALEIDGGNPIALVVLARTEMQLRFHWSGSEALLLDALRSQPAHLWAHVHLAEQYLARGLFSQARQALSHAQSLGTQDDPFPRLPVLGALVHYFERSFDAACEQLISIVQAYPGFALAEFFLAKAQLARGRCEDALVHAARAASAEIDPLMPGQPDVRRRALALTVQARARQRDAAGVRAAAARLDAHAATLPPSHFCAAIVAMAYGRPEGALRAMEAAIANRESFVCFSGVEPLIDPLRRLPGWRRLAAELNLPES